LAAAFVGLVNQPFWALGVLALAGVTDVLDGYVARRFGQATPTGAVVDGVMDKLFVCAVIGSLLLQRRLDGPAAGVLVIREVAEVPLVAWWAMCANGRGARAEDPRANWVGKVATVCQFMAIASALLRREPSMVWLALAGIMGGASALGYWRRELGATRAKASRPAAAAHVPAERSGCAPVRALKPPLRLGD
jgi:CDP-diacylglycerol--glycerol-3-phosphate 3-phosphatidyltransferase/cardiolipin synthase